MIGRNQPTANGFTMITSCSAVPRNMPLPPADRSSWIVFSNLELGPFPGAVPCARLHARLVMSEWGMSSQVAGDVEIVTAELVTNAVVHAMSGEPWPVFLSLLSNRRQILIAVSDCSANGPVLMPPDDGERDGGRGLLVVDALSIRWGWQRARTGKSVWSLMAVT
jgi:anti-sigma regulatory factor (Ser/Thr protein kinase)